jgi:hypothetical protein
LGPTSNFSAIPCPKRWTSPTTRSHPQATWTRTSQADGVSSPLDSSEVSRAGSRPPGRRGRRGSMAAASTGGRARVRPGNGLRHPRGQILDGGRRVASPGEDPPTVGGKVLDGRPADPGRGPGHKNRLRGVSDGLDSVRSRRQPGSRRSNAS